MDISTYYNMLMILFSLTENRLLLELCYSRRVRSKINNACNVYGDIIYSHLYIIIIITIVYYNVCNYNTNHRGMNVRVVFYK